MIRKLITALLLVAIGFYFGNKHGNDTTQQIVYSIEEQTMVVAERPMETTQAEQVRNLERILLRFNSPLAAQSAYLVGVANEYGLDYRLLPAIAYTESTLCKHYPKSSFNCWGWGSAAIHFGSFEEAIETISRKLSSHGYYASWRQNKSNIWQLAQTYNGKDTKKWTQTVVGFMEQIER